MTTLSHAVVRIHAAVEKRPVMEGEIDGEADGRDGKDCDKEPALPVAPRARWQEYEGDEYGHPRHPLRDGFLVERIHTRRPTRNVRPKRDPNSERTSFSSDKRAACADRSLPA